MKWKSFQLTTLNCGVKIENIKEVFDTFLGVLEITDKCAGNADSEYTISKGTAGCGKAKEVYVLWVDLRCQEIYTMEKVLWRH